MPRQKKENYEEFVEKFKLKKTTDDCYTPPKVYEAVAEWVANEYGLDRKKFVRPFYPGGDYELFDYTNGAIVVDNPPFSILAKIADFYTIRNIPFFLFAPNLTLFSLLRGRACTALVVDGCVVYDNGANVKTSFLTNLEPCNLRARTVPSLYRAIKKAVEEVRKETTKQLPKYKLPYHVAQAARLNPYSKLGIEIRIPRDESVFIAALDSQKEQKKSIFGGGLLVSNRVAAALEKAALEKAALEKVIEWTLSDQEKEIAKNLDDCATQITKVFEIEPES